MIDTNERQFIEIENINGEVEKVEIFAEIKSKRDNKYYVLMTADETIEEEVNVAIGHIYKDNNKMNVELIENEEEINYVYSLLNEMMVGA